MHTLLYDALFGKNRYTPPLFESQRELARCLCDLPGKKDYHPKSTAAFLSQILMGRRRMPSEMQRKIRIIIEHRGNERGMSIARITALYAMLGLDSIKGALVQLITEQSNASDTLILNAYPLELSDAKREHKEAMALQNLVLDALETERRYRYCVADQTIAQQLWKILRGVADEKYGDGAAGKMQSWAAKGLIAVSVVPELMLLHPTVVYNTSMPDRLSAFVWHVPYDWERVLPIPTRQIVPWLAKVQDTLDNHSQAVPFQA